MVYKASDLTMAKAAGRMPGGFAVGVLHFPMYVIQYR